MGIFNVIDKFSRKPGFLFLAFITILMMANIVLLFTEPMRPIAKFAFILLPLGFQMLLLSLIKKPGLTFLILLPKCILDAFQLVLIKLYGGSFIAVDMFLNLVTTNSSEAGELLSNIAPMILFMLIIYIPSIMLAIHSLKNRTVLKLPFRDTMLKISTCILSSGVIFFAICQYGRGCFDIKYDLYPINVICNMDFALKKWDKMANCGENIERFHFRAYRELSEKDNNTYKGREIYVMMIGETARAMNWSLYGYNRKTTPFADTCRNIIKFNALTQSNTTHKSVPMLLTPADADNFELLYRCKSIVTLFKECGFRSVYLTNHSYRQTFMERYFNEADIKVSLKNGNRNSYDIQMVDSLKKIFAQDTSSNMFVVMHLYGSHFNYRERYTSDFAEFLPDCAEAISPAYKQELTNGYDNSILSTDNVIKQTVELLKSQNCKSFMVYTSDHGEDLMDDRRERFLHASPIPTAYQLPVPFIFWHSNEYRWSEIRKIGLTLQNTRYCISSNEVLFHSVANWASIKGPYVKEELSLCSNNFEERPPRYLTDHDRSIRISELPLKRLDRQIFEKGIFIYD